MTGKRALVAMIAMIGLVAGTYGTRLALSLGALTHQNPLAALLDILRGKGGSDVQQRINDLRRINIALYGYGGPPHDGPYLTDSILVVSIQPRRESPPQVAEVSLPRDWYVPIQLGDGQTAGGRVNEAFQTGVGGTNTYPKARESGAKVANATLEKALGIHIDHYVGVDFTAFQDGVDAVGGIDVDVPNSFTDRQYPRGECRSDGGGDCAFKTVRFRAGRQHMDGSTALIFSRSRHSTDNGEGSDFARGRRQQLVLQALKAKAVSAGGLGHLPDLLNALSDHVTTDLAIGDAEALYDLVKGVDHQSIARLSLDDTNFLYECGFPANCDAAYLYAHDRSFRSVGRFMEHLFPDPGVVAEKAPISIIDGTGAGAAASARWGGLLRAIGFTARDGGQARSRPSTRLIDDSGGRFAQTADWLAEYFGLTVERGQAVEGGGVRLILGQDEERAFNGSRGSATPASSRDTSAPPASTRATAARPASSRDLAAPPAPSGTAVARPASSRDTAASRTTVALPTRP
ncbi:MAG: LCP family protein [Candidatus Dormibacteria bacterium]